MKPTSGERFDSAIVQRAMVETVTDLGQFSHQERLDLEYAVRKGWLCKGQGGPFPKLKTVYACPGFDFAGSRAELVAEMMLFHAIDRARGVAHFFPCVPFQSTI